MLKKSLKLIHFSLILSIMNLLFFYYPFFKFTVNNLDYLSWSGILLICSMVVLAILLNGLLFGLLLFISKYVGKFLVATFFIVNALATHFVFTYGVIIDKSMVGNVLNTNYQEASSFYSFWLVLYVIAFGILPAVFVIKTEIIKPKFSKFFSKAGITLVIIAALIFANATNWLWIDKYSKQLGGLAVPWSYSINLGLYYKDKSNANEKEIILPNIKIKDNKKAVVVLVIGESARKSNFSLYGYKKNTNPLLSKVKNLTVFNANSSTTYTTGSVKRILEHTSSSKLYETLPNYLERNNVEVVWRTTNSGEPPLHIRNIQKKDKLLAMSKIKNANYDEILIAKLKEQITSSTKNKVLIILHSSTSHGPAYNKKYPPQFEVFKPVCTSVELSKCSQSELINAYDNTIVYTDYILFQIIQTLKELKDYDSSMIYVSDHGESLGEKNLYMHGVPISFAPKEQYEIPFIVWTSGNTKRIKPITTVTQGYVFHSVMKFLSLESPIYNEELNFYK